MSLFSPNDACPLHPETKTRMGPGFASTFVIIVCFLFLLANASANTIRARSERKGELFNIGSLLIQFGFFYLYFVYYVNCRPWTGWFLYVFVALAVLLIFGLFVPPPENTVKKDTVEMTPNVFKP